MCHLYRRCSDGLGRFRQDWEDADCDEDEDEDGDESEDVSYTAHYTCLEQDRTLCCSFTH